VLTAHAGFVTCLAVPSRSTLRYDYHRFRKPLFSAPAPWARAFAAILPRRPPLPLMDIVRRSRSTDRNKIVLCRTWRLRENLRPGPLFSRRRWPPKIAIGNFEDDLAAASPKRTGFIEVGGGESGDQRGCCQGCQYRKARRDRDHHTSGFPSPHREGLPQEFSKHWAGTHFFNPPRYMKLVEFIPGPKTSPTWWRRFAIFATGASAKAWLLQGHAQLQSPTASAHSMLNALRLMSISD